MEARIRAGGTIVCGTSALQSLLGEPGGEPAPGSLVGLEHEYRLSRDGRTVDFRDMIHGLAVPGLRLDPGGTNAYRCPSGLALTCDDAAAEVASPPLAVLPRFTCAIEDWARTGRALLDDLLPDDVAVEGFSTHLSAAMPDRHADRALDLLPRAFAPH